MKDSLFDNLGKLFMFMSFKVLRPRKSGDQNYQRINCMQLELIIYR